MQSNNTLVEIYIMTSAKVTPIALPCCHYHAFISLYVVKSTDWFNNWLYDWLKISTYHAVVQLIFDVKAKHARTVWYDSWHQLITRHD